MHSWILPGRRDAPKMRYKAILERSLAFSRTCNPRNLEYQWYPLWDQTLDDLVTDVSNLIVAPQYPVWFVPQDDEEVEEEEEGEGEDEDDGRGGDPEEIITSIGESNPEESTALEDDDAGEEVADVSFASTMQEKSTKSVLVDFVIINVNGVPRRQKNSRYGGWRITRANVGLLVEVKRFVSRSLTGVELEKALEARVSEAHEDLITQAAHLFLQEEDKDSVLAIAAAGPWWCSAKINRDDVKMVMHRLASKDPTYQAHTSGAAALQLNWSSLLRLDVARSNDRSRIIYNSLKGIGVLETPVNV
ncbi:hypothetical protein K503DRAFT_774595 [Rhizopogon vinicolor AM-OR11-026]|uniref:Uncharacterized protein n=1 Tax=Rhizopogon vinicolor AM-OR11-026 TaxID=1314800 RepID=A0A1B7MP73_9AGAM|nr:hypothetical protein K503DRAFT_774595 [Rhizopogon vinicolor AM-OR11-026]